LCCRPAPQCGRRAFSPLGPLTAKKPGSRPQPRSLYRVCATRAALARSPLPPAVGPIRALTYPGAAGTPAAAPPPAAARTSDPPRISPRRRGRAVDPIRPMPHPTSAGTPAADPSPLSTGTGLPPSILPRRWGGESRIDEASGDQHRGNRDSGKLAHAFLLCCPCAA
jgi:hypothetical protein